MNDPAHEYRRLEVLLDGNNFLFFESTLFASDPALYRTAMTKMDSEQVVLAQLKREIERLCKKEDFAVVSKEGETFVEDKLTSQSST
jgi:hypothetical protein